MTTPTNNPNQYAADEWGTPDPWNFDADAVVYEFMTAGGANDSDTVTDLLADDPEGAAALAEMLDEWTLWCDRNDLPAAMARFIADRPDIESE